MRGKRMSSAPMVAADPPTISPMKKGGKVKGKKK
jgi:hypothetical protein